MKCGVSKGSTVGFSVLDDNNGKWTGLDVDLCRAVAAAVLGDAKAVEFVDLFPGERFEKVRDGTVDVLIRTTTDTLNRDAHLQNGGEGVNFGPTYFYDGSSIMARPDSLGACVGDPAGCRFEDLPDGLSVCVEPDSSVEDGLMGLEDELGITFVFVASDSGPLFGFFGDECDATVSDQSALLNRRQFGIELEIPGAVDWVVFNDTFSKEPLAPVVREGDDEWMAVVRWTIYATFLAEELGLTQQNISQPKNRNSSDDASRAFGDFAAFTGEQLGLGPDWGFDIIKQVGNYAEMYQRNLTTPLGLPRGRNASYLDGGLIYAPPIRPF